MIDPQLSDALVDVRKAYRLLWSYQRRTLDMAQLIGDQFPELIFYEWNNNRADNPVQRSSNPLRRWAWDMLPLYGVSVLFVPAGIDYNNIKAGEWMLEICISADSGFREDDDGNEPDIANFEEARSSKSTVDLYGWQCTSDLKTTWRQLWSNNNWPLTDDEPIEHVESSVRILRKNFDLASLPDSDTVKDAASSFKMMLTRHFGIDGH